MIHETLRFETRQLHATLDSHPLMTRLLARNLTRHEYGEILARFYGFLAPFEPRLAGALGGRTSELGLAAGQRTASLAADLDVLDIAPAAVSLCPSLPALPSEGDAVGALYVLQGSMLGGRVIARRISQSIGVTPQRGAAFFASAGIDVDREWAKFLAALAAWHEARGETVQAVRGAQATFGALAAWFDGVGL